VPGPDRIRSPHEPVSTPVPRVRVDGVDVGDDACVGGTRISRPSSGRTCGFAPVDLGDADKRVP